MKVAAVPSSLTQEQVCDWLAQIGVDPNRVPRATSLTLGPHSIDIEVLATDEDGEFYVGPSGDELATHRISIPITRSS